MTTTQDWRRNRETWIRILTNKTGLAVDVWKRRIRLHRPKDEKGLRDWLTKEGVTGYAQSLLVMEQFGYPDYLTATADELIDRQYADRPELRPIYDAIVEAAGRLGPLTIQARKTYVSLVSPRRTFARVVPATKTRIDLGLRLDGHRPAGRLQASRIHPTMTFQVGLSARGEVDSEVVQWLRQAYLNNS
jgi:hypothetical protein